MATEIQVKEILVSASGGIEASGRVAMAGFFEKGPVDEFIEIESVPDLEATMGKPTEDTIYDFLSAYDHLQYGNNLVIQRIVPTNARLARKGIDTSGVAQTIDLYATGEDDNTTFPTYEDNPHFFFDYQERNATAISYPLEFWTKSPYDSSNTSNPTVKVYAAKYSGSDWATDLDDTNASTGQTLTIGDTGSDFSDWFEVGTKQTNDDAETVNEIALVITENGVVVESHMVSTVENARNDAGINYYISEYLDRNSN